MSEQDYALVSGGIILAVCRAAIPPMDGSFSDEFPGDSQWLPIIDVDSRLLDATKHVRLAYEINGHIVRRISPCSIGTSSNSKETWKASSGDG